MSAKNTTTDEKQANPKAILSIRIDAEIKKDFEGLAKQDRRTASDLLRILIEDFVAEKKPNADINAAA